MKSEKTIPELLEFSIINIDKPTGPTSFQVSQFVKNSLGLKKTAHFGTLDPAVTGVLPVGLNRACRLNEYLMHKNKTYIGVMRTHKEVSMAQVEKIISKFIGKIKQLPPVRSAVKRQVREREVTSFKILEKDGKDFLFETEVQAGTYVRRICDDIGKEIEGAHMLELRRVKAGIFDEKSCVTLYDFEKALVDYKEGREEALRKILIPAEHAVLEILPSIQFKDPITKLLTGRPIMKGDVKLPKEEKFSIFQGNRFIGIYKKVDEGDIVAKSEFIFN